ncbi:HOPs/CORVET complex ubiquitin protein ligase E3 subunit Vps11 [Schizosaccharomyces osmophilus]|uniref:E3 ubiquitin-protein ligase PEP5 n=1 Tax=Schizosaccharomyces osmophilus TaxID=2545709 RepID=A0AAE9WBE8_9SCHI|nr:HOPs/CORVET complex ubiquitin protein ligase E3 subunit Vps11 [Schizosaccharomyces osmophilus]WBW73095.1 HOPs/CORVET complex ubiquitin protein ligase E3 subunit Vps11 [Schizosaccharomyces osmophilus]
MTTFIRSWKRVTLFQKHELPQKLGRTNVSIASFGNQILACNTSGRVTLYDSSLGVKQVIDLEHEVAIQQILWIDNDRFLLFYNFGEQDGPSFLVIYAFSCSQEDPSLEKKFSLVSANRFIVDEQPHPIVAVSESLSDRYLACGFGGHVLAFYGTPFRERGLRISNNFKLSEPITSLAFHKSEDLILYVSTTNKTYSIKGKNITTLDTLGTSINCSSGYNEQNISSLTTTSPSFICSRSDGLTFYFPSQDKVCFTFPGEKHFLATQGPILALHYSPTDPSATGLPNSRKSMPSSNSFSRLEGDRLTTPLSRLLLIDLPRKLIVWEGFLRDHSAQILSIDEGFLILTSVNSFLKLKRIDLNDEISLLSKKTMYDLAISLSRQKNMDSYFLQSLMIEYARFLFRKGDYSLSMDWYIKSIRSVNIPVVCLEFLKAERLDQLIRFIEALMQNDLANSDLKLLLLSCHVETKNLKGINRLIDTGGFAFNQAFDICHRSGFLEEAKHLGIRFNNHERVIDVLLEEKKYSENLDYMYEIAPSRLLPLLLRFGRVLLSNLPKETTDLFISFYSNNHKSKQSMRSKAQTKYEKSLRQTYLSLLPYANATPFGISSMSADHNSETTEERADSEEPQVDESYIAPNPQTCFHIFLNHNSELIRFLEAILPHVSEEYKTHINTCLFEAYIRESHSSQDENAQGFWKKKANLLLKDSEKHLDLNATFLISQILEFDDGVRFVQGKSGQTLDIFRSFCKHDDVSRAMEMVRAQGEDQSELYIMMLNYFASTNQLEPWSKEVKEVTEYIINHQLISPTQLAEILGKSDAVTLGMIEEAVENAAYRFESQISEKKKGIEIGKSEILELNKELSNLRTTAFVVQESKCSACNTDLELPMVHFRCRHSYHLRCIEDECIRCQWL